MPENRRPVKGNFTGGVPQESGERDRHTVVDLEETVRGVGYGIMCTDPSAIRALLVTRENRMPVDKTNGVAT